MRIAVIGPSYPFRGGIAHYTTLLCSSLSQKHEVKLISLSRQYPSILFPGKKQTDESEVKLMVPGAEPLVDSMNPSSWLRAARRIRQFAPDLVIIQWWHPFFAPAFGKIASMCRRFSRVMFVCHNVLPHERGGPVKRLTKYALGKGDMFIVHSGEDMDNLKSLSPNAKVAKARHPTYEVFAQCSREDGAKLKATARKELGLTEDDNVVLFFGLVREYKGLRYLIQAMPYVLTSVDARLVVAGEFYDDQERYMALINELAVGHRVMVRNEYIPNEKVATYFQAADLVVLPYISATQSGIVQIAYGFDRPVITTSVGGLPEAVKDGETGYVVPPFDSRALADAITKFFREDNASDFAANIREFREEFSWERMVNTIETLTGEGGRLTCSSS